MKKFGNFWVPDADAKGPRNRRKMHNLFGEKDGSIEPLELALQDMRANRPEFLSRPGSAIDAGANVGSYTRILANCFSAVYAFEPARDTFQCLERNIYEGGHYANVHLYHAAVGDARAYIGMTRGLFRLSITSTVEGTGKIPAIPLDALRLDDLRFLKLDVEGFEHKALVGAKDTIALCKPAVLMEVKPAEEEKAADPYKAEKLLQSMGYTLAKTVGINRLYYPAE